jgi:hypothetical protein
MAVAKPTLIIPTGFEKQQNAAALKHKLAATMLEQGLKSRNDYTSWAQVLGQLAQAWAGKSLETEAGKADADTNAAIQSAYQARRQAFQNDTKGLNPQAIVEKYGADPMLVEDVKPFLAAFQSGLTRQAENYAGKPVDPNALIIPTGNGGFTRNDAAVGARRAAAGFDSSGYPLDFQLPGMGGPQQAQASTPEQRLAQAMANGTVPPPADTSIPSGNPLDPNLAKPQSPPPTHMTKDGRPAWFINGQYYDNPEGR